MAYLQQEIFWAKTWLKGSGQGHDLKFISVPCGDGFLTGIIYEYPFWKKKNFWYLGRGLLFRGQDIEKTSDFRSSLGLKKINTPTVGQLREGFKKFLKKLEKKAIQEKIVYIQADFDNEFFDLLMF